MQKRILIVLIIICSIITGGCKNSRSETQEFAPSAEASATITPEPIKGSTLDDFDSEYLNLPSTMDSIIQADNHIYFTSGYMFYRFDIEANKKVLIADDIIACNIYLVGGYIYYLRDQTFNRLSLITNEVEELCTATEMAQMTIAEGNTRNRASGINNTLRLLKNSERFVSFEIYGEGEILIVYYEFSGQSGVLTTECSYIYPNDISFVPVQNTNYEKIISPDGETPLFEYESFEVNHENRMFERYKKSFISMPGEKKELVAICCNIADFDYPSENSWGYLVDTVEGSMVLSGRTAYSEYKAEDVCVIIMQNVNTYEKTMIGRFQGSDARLIALDQYVICYYYDREVLDGIDGPTGVILFDTKNNITYENEEINQVISGDIDYINLINTDFYLDGDKLYVLENESIEVAMDDLSDEQKAALSEKEIIIEYGEYLDPVSRSNLYEAEIVDGKLHFTQIFKEF